MYLQFSRNMAITSRLIPLPSYQWLPPVAIFRVYQGWNQENSYLIVRGSRAERGVRAYSPAWSEPPKQNPVSGVE